MVDEVRPASEEGSVWGLGEQRDGAGGVTGAFVTEGIPLAPSLIAGTMFA